MNNIISYLQKYEIERIVKDWMIDAKCNNIFYTFNNLDETILTIYTNNSEAFRGIEDKFIRKYTKLIKESYQIENIQIKFIQINANSLFIK